jgi:hypothetical protein
LISSNLIDIAIAIMLIAIVLSYGLHADCGIPIFLWLMVYSGIFASRSVFALLKIPLIRRNVSWITTYSLITFIITDGAFLSWLIYGNVIFYEKANNCDSLPDSELVYKVMFALIIVGYIQMFWYGILIFCLPCIIFALRNQPDNRPGGVLEG